MTDYTRIDLEQLTATVRVMRELGVTSFDGITLGPDPGPAKPKRSPPTSEQLEAHRRAMVHYEAEARAFEERLAMAHVEDPGEPPVAPEEPW